VFAVRVHEVDALDALAEHAEEWDRLALQAPEQNPMLSHSWVSTFLELQLDEGSTWRCVFAYAGDLLIGVLPVVRTQGLLGTRLHGLRSDDTLSGYALLRASWGDRALSAMLAHLERVEPRYLWLRMRGVYAESTLLSAVPRAHVRGTQLRSRNLSLVPVRGDFADYEAGLSGNFRRNLRKGLARCERKHAPEFRFITGSDADSTDLFQRFVDIEAAGWKGAAGTALKCQPRVSAFYSTLVQKLARRGWLEWHFLHLDRVPVAAHLAVRFGRSLVLPKIGFDETYSRLGPGNQLFRQMLMRAYASDEIDTVNCLTDMGWHRNWNVAVHERFDVVLAPRRTLPMVASKLQVELPDAAIRHAEATPWLAAPVRRAKVMWHASEPLRTGRR
jgi:CelD/BcsL family acetyltransferase involved in cellulose biosynthesis